jgi:hypothetical protein
MRNINYVTCQLLNCWYLDFELLDNLIEAYNLDFDIEEIWCCYWKIDNINILIYEAFRQIKDMFVEENEEEIRSLWFNPDDFEEWEDYEIFTNYFDSSMWFNDSKLDEIYQKWRKR